MNGIIMNRDSWPTQAWPKADPASVGMHAERLAQLEREIEIRFRSINAFLIVRRGRLVFERYYGGCGPDDAHLVASVTKSVVSALIGLAINRGFIEGVHQRVLDFFPELAPGAHAPLKQQMTIRHLLTMTAGFRWRTGARGHELYIDRLRRSKDWVAFILGLPVQERSFGTFHYNSGAAHLLSAILTRSTGQCARDFAAEHLFEPLGMAPPTPDRPHTYSQTDVFRNTDGGWPRDPQGNSIGGWGLMLRPVDMVRFGYLYLNEGRWEDKPIIPKQWIEDSVAPHTPGYGYLWWLRHVNGAFVFAASGQGGNHIFFVPQKDLVVAVASKPGSRWRDRWPLLEQYVLPAVAEG